MGQWQCCLNWCKLHWLILSGMTVKERWRCVIATPFRTHALYVNECLFTWPSSRPDSLTISVTFRRLLICLSNFLHGWESSHRLEQCFVTRWANRIKCERVQKWRSYMTRYYFLWSLRDNRNPKWWPATLGAGTSLVATTPELRLWPSRKDM